MVKTNNWRYKQVFEQDRTARRYSYTFDGPHKLKIVVDAQVQGCCVKVSAKSIPAQTLAEILLDIQQREKVYNE